MKKCLIGLLAVFALVFCTLITSGCGHSKAHVAAHNISVAADQFEVNRRITFINGITDKYLFVIEGACSVQTANSALAGALEVTCQVSKDGYCKDFLGLSDNVTYIIQQIGAINVGTAHYRVLFRPTSIIPHFSNSSGAPGLKVTGSCSGE